MSGTQIIPDLKSSEHVVLPTFSNGVGTPWSLIENKFNVTATYAAESFGYVKNHITVLDDIIKGLETFKVDTIDVVIPDFDELDITKKPGFGELFLNVQWPNNDAVKPKFEDLPELVAEQYPIKNVIDPGFKNIGDIEIANVQDTSTKPTINNIADLQLDALILPPLPVISDVLIPSADFIAIPEFEAKFIDIDIPEPVGMSWSESPYNSDVWKTFLDKVIYNITYGGTGLLPEVEAAIYSRAVNRLAYEHSKTYAQEERKWANLGWPEPVGAVKSRLTTLVAEQDREKAALSKDIMISQAELEQKNSQFYMEMGKSAEMILREFHNSQNTRLLQAAETISKNSIDILNGYVSMRNSNVEVYKSEAIVFSERIKAALQSVEIYKAKVEGAKVTADIQKVYVDLYSAQVGAIETVAKYYSILVENRKTSLEAEKIKMDIYKSEVDIYMARQNAEKIKVDTHSVKAGIEKTKSEILYNQLNAYVEELKAVKEINVIKIQELEYKMKQNEFELERYKSELSAYGIEVNAESNKVDSIIKGFSAEVSAYSAETMAMGSYYSAKTEEIKARIEEARLNATIQIADIEAVTKGYTAVKELEIKATEGVVSVSAQLAASALNAVNASASYGYTGSDTTSYGISIGADFNESHSYPHDPEQ
jgi:hypothetical protein